MKNTITILLLFISIAGFAQADLNGRIARRQIYPADTTSESINKAQWQTYIESLVGGSDHSLLSNLDYASSGHTGFAGTGVENTFTSSVTNFNGYLNSDENLVQSLATTGAPTLDVTDGYIGSVSQLAGSIIVPISNLPDGKGGVIRVQQSASTAYTVNINGVSPYTTERLMGLHSNVDPTLSSYSTIRYWRVGTELFYEFVWNGGVSGIEDHSELNELDYASSGHTGFARTGGTNTFTGKQTISTSSSIVEAASIINSDASGSGLLVGAGNDNEYILRLAQDDGTTKKFEFWAGGQMYAYDLDAATSANVLYIQSDGEITTGAAASTSFSGAKVTRTSNLTISSSGTTVTFDSENFDTDSYHSTSSNTERLSVPEAGYYRISFIGTLVVSTDLGGIDFTLYKTGTNTIAYVLEYDGNDTNLQSSICYSDIHYLTTSDYVYVSLTSRNSNATLYGTTNLSFSIEKL